jgi:hypothetical protein
MDADPFTLALRAFIAGVSIAAIMGWVWVATGRLVGALHQRRHPLYDWHEECPELCGPDEHRHVRVHSGQVASPAPEPDSL